MYDALIERARNRVTKEYTEKHHVIPDFMFVNRKRKGPKGHLQGNPNDPNNIVRLFPREHFVAHLLLVKIYQGTRYWYPAQSSLIFFAKVVSKHPRQRNFKISSYEYELARKMGIAAISAAKKGTMPCVDVETGESVGSHSTQHPNVLSGKWVHHSKGFVVLREISTGITKKVKQCDKKKYLETGNYETTSRDGSGSNNSNYKELAPELKEYIFDCIDKVVVNGYLIKNYLIKEVNDGISAFGIKKISYVFFKNKFGHSQNLVDLYNKSRNKQIKYNPYFRGYDR